MTEENFILKFKAKFLEYKAVQRIFSDWDVDNQFLNLETIPIMWEDGFVSSNPIKYPINSASEIINSYDSSLAASKGASLIRMLESILGENAFKLGLIVNFLRKCKLFKNN